jgi:hypothetical protein
MFETEDAMALFGLEHLERFWEPSLDTRVLVAWGRSRLLLCFRGTASLRNAVADLKVTRSVCQP